MADEPQQLPAGPEPRAAVHVQVPVTGVSMTASNGGMAFALGQHVNVVGQQLQTASGSPAFKLDQHLDATGLEMFIPTVHVEVSGQLVTREFAFPFVGKNVTSPGMTLRQWYAGQALSGFISNSVTANLIGGTLPAYVFKLADSMIAYEAKMTGPPIFNLAPVPIQPPGVAQPPQQGPVTVSPEEVAAQQAQEAAE